MFYNGGMSSQHLVERLYDEAALGKWFDSVEEDQLEVNRWAARRAANLADAVGYAKRHPNSYAVPGDDDAVLTAERCAVIEASARLHMSVNAVRNLVHVADTARAVLPHLWHTAREGFTTLAHVEAAVLLVPQLEQHGDDTALSAFDNIASELAMTCSPTSFRNRARRLANELAPTDAVTAHAEAFAKRRIHVEDAGDGMSWVSLLIDTRTARSIFRRATATAKNMRKRARTEGVADERTRDQARADLAAGWLTGAGTPTAVRTKVFVTVPADVLTDAARASIRDLPVVPGAPNLNEGPRLDTGESIDRVTAIRMLLRAGKFTRVITDPVTGAILDMDRRSRTATRAQNEWLILTHGTCTRDGCDHPAAESDIDHWIEYHGPGRGPTDLVNLHPFCARENQTKQKTKLKYRRRDDGTVQLVTPTGYSTRPPRPGELEARASRERRRARAGIPLPDKPPF